MDSRVFGLISVLFLSAWSMPHRISNIDFRASIRPRPIVLDVSSPAYAAAEDVRLNLYDRYNTEKMPPFSSQAIVVASASKNSAQVEQLKTGSKFIWPTVGSRKIVVLPNTIISSVGKVDHLRELIASVKEAPPTEITVNDYAEILVKEELQKRNKESQSAPREILSTTGTTIVVAKAAPGPTKKVAPVVAVRPLTPVTQTSAPPRQLVANNAKIEPRVLSALSRDIDGFEISGPLTFTKGAALINGHQDLTVRHVIDGVDVERGTINLTEASYRIILRRLEGELIAEVRSRDGQLLARAKTALGDLVEKYGHAARFRDVPLTIEPAFSSLHAEVVAAGDEGENKFLLGNANLQIGGIDREIAFNKTKKQFIDETVVAPSSFLAKATSATTWPTISIAQSGERFQMQLLRSKVIEALLNISLDKYKAREAMEQGLIWGRVMMGAQPVSGAQVRIVGETEKRAIYLNGFMPEKNRETTATSGMYAFSLVEPGEKMLRVNLGDKLYWPTMVITDKKSVTYADLKIESRRNVLLKSMEAFTQAPKVAQMNPLGTDEKYFIPDSGQLKLAVDTVGGLSYLEAFSDDKHVTVRAPLRSGQTELNFTFVTKEWLKKAREHLGLKENTAAGAAIVFVNGDEYEVTLGAGNSIKDKNIVYFDSTGRIIDQPVDDGGFAVLNEPAGFQAITIIPQKSKKVITRLVYFDQYAVADENISLTY